MLSDRKSMYYNTAGQLIEWTYRSGITIGTYAYDSDGYPCLYVYDDAYSHDEYYCDQTNLGNGKIRFDWYSNDESLQGELQWYTIYQDGHMIEYHYCYLEPYTITFYYEQVELPTEQISPYLPSMLITPNEYIG